MQLLWSYKNCKMSFKRISNKPATSYCCCIDFRGSTRKRKKLCHKNLCSLFMCRMERKSSKVHEYTYIPVPQGVWCEYKRKKVFLLSFYFPQYPYDYRFSLNNFGVVFCHSLIDCSIIALPFRRQKNRFHIDIPFSVCVYVQYISRLAWNTIQTQHLHRLSFVLNLPFSLLPIQSHSSRLATSGINKIYKLFFMLRLCLVSFSQNRNL